MSIKPVTLGAMINYKSAKFPLNWINAVTINKSKSKYALFLLSSDNTIRFIPTMGTKVIKFHIDLSENNILDGFLNKILEILVKLQLQSLYNSGVCFSGSECYFEFFIDYPENNIKIDLVKQEIQDLASVSNISTNIYSSSNDI